jgi:hypothetical protein
VQAAEQLVQFVDQCIVAGAGRDIAAGNRDLGQTADLVAQRVLDQVDVADRELEGFLVLGHEGSPCAAAS